MWNGKKSLALSKACVYLFAFALLLLDIEGYFVSRLYAQYREMTQADAMYFAVTIYAVSIPAWTVLYQLWRLLRRIGTGAVFIAENVKSLRIISWCCVAAGVITAASMLYYLPFGIAAVAAIFMALIVRIVKNCFEQAVRMQDELDYTV